MKVVSHKPVAIAVAQKIWQAVGWSNLLLGIPATQIMLPMIEHKRIR